MSGDQWGQHGEVVLRLKPTITRLAKGRRDGGVIYVGLDPEMSEPAPHHPYEIGVPNQGWMSVSRPTVDVARMTWVYPVLDLRPLPPHLQLSEYDVGHQVVIVRGEFMGTQATVQQIQDGRDGRAVYVLSGGGSTVPDALAAVRPSDDQDLAALAPLRVRLPAGSPAWVWASGWKRAVITGYDGSTCAAWLTEIDEGWRGLRSRVLVRPREDEVTPSPIARRPAPARRGRIAPTRRR